MTTTANHQLPTDGAAGRFPRLFSPLRIGSVTLKNRVLSSGHDTVMAEDGVIGDRLIAYHEARAKGGAGLIVLQVSGVHESARYSAHLLMATDDASIPGYRRLGEAVHAHGCAVFAQLFHPGREIMESQDGSAPVALAPSAVPSDRFHVVPRALTTDLIHEIIAGYADAAVRIQAAGLDGVEIVGSHGYLPAQFLDPAVNLRQDRYGGTEDNRLRFLRETIKAVRAAVGDGFVVGLRISATEYDDTGLDVGQTAGVCEKLDADGGLDYISVCAGTSATSAGSDHIAPPMTERTAYTAPLAAAIKAKVRVPVMVAGRINQPQEAEQIITSEQADACAMTRALICDPEMPAKAAAGRTDDIRACIACNQACIGHFHSGYPISCIQHPETGRELSFGTLRITTRRRKVLVIGGGPAGMKAAAVCAQRGHDVTLVEAERRLGGQVLLAERLPDRSEFGGAITNLSSELERAGARILTRTKADSAFVMHESPDMVLVATGARPRRSNLEILGEPTIIDAWDIVRGTDVPSGHIVIADWRCDWVGLGVAHLLADRSRTVTLAVNGYTAGQRLQQYVRDAMLARAARASISILPNVRIYGVDDDTVYLQHTLTREPVIVDGVSAVVMAHAPEPVDGLLTELADCPGDVRAIGDCVAPRTVEEAVLEGMKAGHSV
ncbi:FAD-dependent oxidoreductase [Streptomyces sp. RB6PN25]|uniref:FAD-dependent oxidoreductase n=1 Tax=Streptomyces humicola TaxID=2953240 RepID=A0ABT1PR27_9ACTN|nr:FAD-dependent oxidoreductase [Streptomyces humicola]MCQ4079405.1 FAD-dependent oxidoreductase [Streptomyces humicola]